jgi:O-antigen/teichoic acid export membrane protein
MSGTAAGRCLAAQEGAEAGETAERERVSGLAAKARRGTHAIFATRLLSVVVTFASITILARLIPPAEFGVWAIASFALGLVTLLREFGLPVSIVQAPRLAPQQQDAYFWTSIGVSLACAAILALVAPLLAHIYEAPRLRPVLWICSASLILYGCSVVHLALLRRNLEYGKLVVVEGGGMLCNLLTSVALALLWRDVWALVAGFLAQSLWISVSVLLLNPWARATPRRAAGIDLSFSLQVTLYNVLTYAGSNVGMAAGYRFGTADLGFFNRSYQLYHVAQYAFLTPITEVGFALLSRLKDAAYRTAYIALARRVWVLFIPFAAVLPIVSADLIRAVLGPMWMPAAPILAWFAPAVFGQAFAALFAKLMTSQGRGAELRSWAVLDFLLRAAGAVAGSAYGIVGVAAGLSLATLFVTVPLMAWIAGRSGPVRIGEQLAAMWPGAVLAAAAVLAAVLAAAGADALGLGTGWAKLLFSGGAAFLAWGSACLLLRPAWDALLGRGMAHE